MKNFVRTFLVASWVCALGACSNDTTSESSNGPGDTGGAGGTGTGGTGSIHGVDASGGTTEVGSDGGGPGASGPEFNPLEEPAAATCVPTIGFGGGPAQAQESLATVPTAVDMLRVKDGYAYVAGTDNVVSRYALAGGEAELVGQAGPWFEVDNSHLYYLPPFDDDSSTVRRRNKAGGGEESSDNLFDPPIWRPKTFVLTDNHVVAFQDEKIVAVPKGNLNDARILGSAYADFATFDGTNVIWLNLWSTSSDVLFEISALDVRTGNRHLAYSKRAQFVGEDWKLWGANCTHVFFQKCESTGHFCTTLRVSTEGGEPETFTALERTDDALETVLVTPGGLFYVQGANVLRLGAPDDEPTTVWQPQTDEVAKALAFDGTTLYVASVFGETTTLWSVPQ